MRDIKFRGLSVNGEWYHGLLAISQGHPGQPEKGHYISNSVGMPWGYQVRPETVGQYTGLEDKNGVAIYQGDILFWDGSVLGSVVFEHAEYLVGMGVDARALCASKEEQREVIGNIHENPEMKEFRK